MIVIAFDIGIKNLAWSSVAYSLFPLDAASTTTSTIITPEIEAQMIEKMNILNLDVFDATLSKSSVEEEGGGGMISIYRRIHEYMNGLEYVWGSADVFLIEQQMSTGKVYNVKALKVSQHIIAYFMLRHPTKKVIEYNANLKTSLFGVHLRQKKDRKKWSIDKVHQMTVDDPVIQDYIDVFQKKDDVSDCILMTFVYIFQTMIRKNKKN